MLEKRTASSFVCHMFHVYRRSTAFLVKNGHGAWRRRELMKASIARRCDVRVRPFEPAAQQDHIIRQTRHLARNNGDRSAEAGGCSGVIVRTITRQVSSSCAFDTTTQQLIGENECLKVRVVGNTTIKNTRSSGRTVTCLPPHLVHAQACPFICSLHHATTVSVVIIVISPPPPCPARWCFSRVHFVLTTCPTHLNFQS